jgi:thioredoxin-dependent peroxiredoxin
MKLDAEHVTAVGSPAPDFELETNKGERWRLSDHLGNVAALLFYPKDETLVCTRQLCSVRDNWVDYLKTKAIVVGISPGTADVHDEFSRHHNLPIPLLADTERTVTKMYSSHWLFPLSFMRGIVIVDAKGIIRAKKTMLRAFRPTDRSVIKDIYAARADQLHETFDALNHKNIIRK